MENTATQSQIERANKTKALGSPVAFEAILAMIIKTDLKKAGKSKQMTKKDIEQMNIRNSTMTSTKSHYELLQEGIMKNLPSSLK